MNWYKSVSSLFIQNRLKATAYHESGHAIAALILNYPFDIVSIESRGETIGFVSFKRKPDEIMKLIGGKIDPNNLSQMVSGLKKIYNLIGIINTAGIVCESIQLNLTGWLRDYNIFSSYFDKIDQNQDVSKIKDKTLRLFYGSYYDFIEIKDFINISRNDPANFIYTKALEAEKILIKEWHAVNILAQILLESGSISFDDIGKIIKPIIKGKA
jgi:hypothetical protein